jgi:hypothetical protein
MGMARAGLMVELAALFAGLSPGNTSHACSQKGHRSSKERKA